MTAATVVPVKRANLLTANQRLHWRQKAQRTRTLRDLTYVTARPAVVPFPDRMRCIVGVSYPDARRRDVHNLMPTVKACIDGLVDAGWLTDDSDRYLQGPDLRPSDERCSKDLACTLTFTFEDVA
jgi:crossover junction endodeoxyribonuclease RusA